MPRMLGLVIGCSVAASAACTASVVVWREATAEVCGGTSPSSARWDTIERSSRREQSVPV